MRAYEHDAMPAGYQDRVGEKEQSTIPREPDAMRPLPQWYEITEWERQIVKEQEHESNRIREYESKRI